MKKTTVINHTTSTGENVKIIIVRTHGMEKYKYNDDGYEMEAEKFEDGNSIAVEFDGKTYRICQIENNKKAPFGRVIRLDSRQLLCLPENKWEEVDNAINEKLTNELSNEDKLDIESVKRAEASGHVLPREELKRKRDEYNKGFNEGGYGYNPYDSYMTAEEVSMIKAKFPEQFVDEQ